ncbi:MAG: tetratricopeptide repeat protein [Halochromatium sp.]
MNKSLSLLTLAALLLPACAAMERSGPPAPIVESQPAPRVEPVPIEPPPETPAAPTQVYAYTPPEEIMEEIGDSRAAAESDSDSSAAAESDAQTQADRSQTEPQTPARPTSDSEREPRTAESQPGTSRPSPSESPTEPDTTAPDTPPSAASEPTRPAPSDEASGADAPPAPEVASARPSALAPAGMPPAVASLAERAEQQRQSGDAGGAAATLERALRIQPQEAYLWNRLARVRLEQGMSDSASKLATRSNALTGDQPALKRNNWEIIANARRQAGDIEGAIEAERRATDG